MILDGQRIVVTGGTGSLGKCLVRRLLAGEMGQPAKVVVFSRDEAKQHAMRQESHGWSATTDEVIYGDRLQTLQFVVGDVRDYRAVSSVLQSADVVIHAAALKQVPTCEYNPLEAVLTNVMGAANITRALREGHLPVDTVLGVSTDKACLDYFAPVRLADGSTRKIADLVREKYAGEVVTVGRDGFTTSRVVGWHKNPQGGRKLIGISYARAHRHRGLDQKVWLTDDHLVLTPSGWIAAGQIENGDSIVTGEVGLNAAQYAMVVGMVLGDASIVPTSSDRAFLRTEHHDKDAEWEKEAGQLPKGASAQWGELRDRWYPNGQKIVARGDVEKAWSPRMLAAWFMDDGCMSVTNGGRSCHARLATHGYTTADAEWLADQLTLHGFVAHVLHVRVGEYGPYPEIRLSSDGSCQFFQAVGPYLMGKLRRKLPDWAPPYQPGIWECGKPQPYIGAAIVDHTDHYPPLGNGERKRKRGHRRSVYCLDVEDTHNFVASDVVVHNCKPVNVYGMTKAIQERLFLVANLGASTRFVSVRYGNVLASRGSVVPLFHDQIERGGPVTVTAQEMTRFFFTIDDAVDTVFAALKGARPGETWVPRLPAVRMQNLADVLIDGRPIEIEYTGIRPGEKLHEVLVSEEEVGRTVGSCGHYVVRPILPEVRDAGGAHRVAWEESPADLRGEFCSAHALLPPHDIRALLARAGLLEGGLPCES